MPDKQTAEKKSKRPAMSEKKLESKYGYFSADGREFVITRPDTPRPWVNVISNGDYGIVESQTGSGFTWRNNYKLSRLTDWDQDLIRDESGKHIYVRDRESGEFWSGTWKPCCPQFDFYEVRHGQGYSILTGTYKGITLEKTVFVDAKRPAEVWKVVLRNDSDRPRKMSLFPYLVWCLGNAEDTHREFQKTFIETEYIKELNAVWGLKRAALVPGFISTGLSEAPLQGFLASTNVKPVSYDGDKETFLGRYGTLQAPKAVAAGKLENHTGRWGDAAAALQVDVDLKPGEAKTVIFVIGCVNDNDEARAIVDKYRTAADVESGLKEVKDLWNDLITASTVHTPDEALDFMTNTWLKYQAISARIWAKCAYYQQSGGYGFRDQLQDAQIFLSSDPAQAKKQIIMHAEQQTGEGTVRHWWHHGTNTGPITNMTDDLLWLPYMLTHYLDETDDLDTLDLEVNFLPDKDGKVEKGTLYEHSIRAIEKVFSRWSPRGLPLIGEGDWNDGMSHVGIRWKGESVWLGHFLYGVLERFIPYIEERGENTRAADYRKRAADLKNAINEHAWDGEWYIRATRDDGKPLGSHRCDEGKIFLNAQTWAVMHGTATPERGEAAMNSAERHLFREYGPLLFTPGYSKTDAGIGYLSRYAPSVRENGGVYTHAACWGIIAECVLGRGDKAYEAYRNMLPAYRGLDPDLYFAEPYVTPGNVDGPDSPHFGRGGWTWYSGSGAWLYRAAYDWICGIRAERKGLRIDPCIPKAWPGFSARRLFRGAVYDIEVENPTGISRGVREIRVDGKAIEGQVIAPHKDGKTHKVVVVMGNFTQRGRSA